MEKTVLEDLLEKLLLAEVGETIEDADGNPYVVYRAGNGCRFVRLDSDSILMEQNKNKDSRFARMAQKGRKIGWVIPKGASRWQLVMIKERKPEANEDFQY